jgi:hypothetical protein
MRVMVLVAFALAVRVRITVDKKPLAVFFTKFRNLVVLNPFPRVLVGSRKFHDTLFVVDSACEHLRAEQ